MRTQAYFLGLFVSISLLSAVSCQDFPDKDENSRYPTQCVYSEWTPCSATCGPFGRRTRTCSYGNNITYTEMGICNTTCLNGGTIHGSYCECPSSKTGLCCELQVDPALSLEMVTNGNEVNFKCSLSSVTPSASVQLHFRWFANEESIFNMTLPSTESTATMEQSSWAGKMGTSIHCEVEIPTNGTTDVKRSHSYFAGVRVDGTFGEVVELYENANEHVIELESTIPLLCDSCEVTLPVFVTDRYGIYKPYPDVVVKDRCGAVVTPSNSLPGQKITVTIKARRDFFRDGDGTVYLGFLPVQDSLQLWNGYHLIHLLQVKTYDKDNNNRKCHGVGDPHYYSFDGQYYDVYKPGEYIFYKHERYPFEVQTRLKPCGSVACNCGVAVRVEDDVIIIDRCKTRSELVTYYWGDHKYQYYRQTSQLIAKVLRRGDLAPGFRLVRENSGMTYKIHFPNGAYVEIQGNVYLGVYYSPGSDDFDFENAGFCGSSDGNKTNDLLHGPFKTSNKHYSQGGWGTKHDFSETWRTPGGKNLFYGELDDSESDASYSAPGEYCTCTPSLDELTLNTDFSQVTVNQQCRYTQDNARSETSNECDSRYCDVTEDYIEDVEEETSTRRRRATEDESDDLYFSYDPDFVPSLPGSWPTSSGITEADATKYCEDLLKNSLAGVACSSVVTTDDMDAFIETCKTDIQVLDSLDSGDQTGEAMKSQCQEKATKDPTLWVFGPDGRLAPPTTILGILCPANCNNNGTCTDGKCVCNNGYAGTDCSVNLNVEPEVYMAHKSGLCDSKTDDCTYVSVYGRNFAESDQLTCHINIIEITSDGFTRTDEVLTASALFVTFEEVKCMTRTNPGNATNSTQPYGSLIAISNDGQLVSAELLVIIYNPNCDVCNGTHGYCTRRDDVCVSDGDCYVKDHPNCKDNLTYILVGSILGGIAAIAVIVIIIIVVKKTMAKKSKVAASDSSLRKF